MRSAHAASPIPRADEATVSPLTEEIEEDIYFLDRQAAINRALQSNTLRDDSGRERLQLCYHDGDPVDGAPLNLINVPINRYSDFFASQSLPLPTRITCLSDNDPQQNAAIVEAFEEMNREIQVLREQSQQLHLRTPVYQDSYFLEPRIAFHTAMQQNPVSLAHPTVHGLQICYYDGECLDGAPDNLINVRLEDAIQFFSQCRTRAPKTMVLPPQVDPDTGQALQNMFSQIMEQVKQNRHQHALALTQEIKQHQPILKKGEKPRVFLPTTRVSTVMQYVSRNLAHAFEKIGFDTYLCIESSQMERMEPLIQLSEQISFDPHIVFSVNHLNNSYLNDQLYNFVWFQDPMPEIADGKPLTLRSKDLLIGLPDMCKLLKKSGVDEVIVTHHCVDIDQFRPNKHIDRENKIVFAGTNIDGYDKVEENELSAVNTAKALLFDLIDSGKEIRHADIDQIVQKTQLPRYSVYNRLFYFCVRSRTLHWLCRQKELPVEIYGSGWENDPLIAPYAKGRLPYEQLPDIYASARYAFIPASDNLHLQRLGEVAASGCIPLSFDIRHLTDPPLWENELLYFRTPEELVQRLHQRPRNNPLAIAGAMSFDRLLQRVFSRLVKQHPDFKRILEQTKKMSDDNL